MTGKNPQRNTSGYAVKFGRKTSMTDTDIEAILEESAPAEAYVRNTWPKLQRSLTDLYLGGCKDPKVPPPKDNRYFLYISQDEDIDRVRAELEAARSKALVRISAGSGRLPESGLLPDIEVRRLPDRKDLGTIPPEEHGLLYVPKPYIVPGVRYNEMYNWDSMFVVRGLLENQQFDMAKFLVDDLLYEADHYGTILNGNRTYYLSPDKSRSQPPLISTKVLNIYDNWDKLKLAKEESSLEWLKHAAASIESYSRHWLTLPHFHEESGLSRYASNKSVPSPEVEYGEPGHYDGALKMLTAMYHRQQAIGDKKPLSYQDRKDRYYLEQYLTVAADGQSFALSPAFYRGDDAMRESGFDPSRRFGIYNVDIINHLPVCLNSLRLKMEEDMVQIYEKLAQHEPQHAATWQKKSERWQAMAGQTRERINRFLWDDGKDDTDQQVREPCYRDRNLNTQLCKKHDIPAFRDYNFATAFFPLWVGAASQEQADLVIQHILPKLKTENGLNTSDRETGCQWDKPMMWAPLQLVAVEALERYNHYHEALDVASSFLKTISRDFDVTGKLWEKYESVHGSSNIIEHINKGYSVNDEGFAWTNAAVVELRQAVRRLQKKIRHEALGAPEEVVVHRPVKQDGGPAQPEHVPGQADQLKQRRSRHLQNGDLPPHG